MRRFDLIVVEGNLEIAVAMRLLSDRGHHTTAGLFVNKRGHTNFWRDAPRLNDAARHVPIFGLVDLEGADCASKLIKQKLRRQKSDQFVLRVAVRMMESWLLADIDRAAEYFTIPRAKIPRQPDSTPHPKRELLRLVQLFGSRELRADMLPSAGTTAITGPLYEERLADYARSYWTPEVAASRSPSLAKALKAIDKFLAS